MFFNPIFKIFSYYFTILYLFHDMRIRPFQGDNEQSTNGNVYGKAPLISLYTACF